LLPPEARVEREILLSGIGGQGVQLGAQLLARAAIAEGRQVQLFGSYGGMMRGGNTDATLVVADEPVAAPPTVDSAWSAIVLHPAYAGWIGERLRGGGLVLVNTTVLAEGDDLRLPGGIERLEVPAAQVAVEVGTPALTCMVALGAYVAATGLVALERLCAALPDALPPYRQQHVATSQQALAAGAALVSAPLVVAWPAQVPA
jgi:Pyruvate/2-oxoacid:ferredoxin oxidoreductase gamma subunit